MLTCSPHRSGNVVGGSYWILERLLDNTKICYVNSWNREKERHLNGVDVVEYGTGCDCLVWRVGAGRGAQIRNLLLNDGGGNLPGSLTRREVRDERKALGNKNLSLVASLLIHSF